MLQVLLVRAWPWQVCGLHTCSPRPWIIQGTDIGKKLSLGNILPCGCVIDSWVNRRQELSGALRAVFAWREKSPGILPIS